MAKFMIAHLNDGELNGQRIPRRLDREAHARARVRA
jgi:hypothetical protein